MKLNSISEVYENLEGAFTIFETSGKFDGKATLYLLLLVHHLINLKTLKKGWFFNKLVLKKIKNEF